VAVALQNDTQINHITNRIQITYTSNTQNNKKHKTYTSNINTTQNTTLKKEKEVRN
jgi:hypothetical protein